MKVVLHCKIMYIYIYIYILLIIKNTTRMPNLKTMTTTRKNNFFFNEITGKVRSKKFVVWIDHLTVQPKKAVGQILLSVK